MWFQRAWIVQEFGVSQDGVFICGHEEIPKKDFLDIIVLLYCYGDAICSMDPQGFMDGLTAQGKFLRQYVLI